MCCCPDLLCSMVVVLVCVLPCCLACVVFVCLAFFCLSCSVVLCCVIVSCCFLKRTVFEAGNTRLVACVPHFRLLVLFSMLGKHSSIRSSAPRDKAGLQSELYSIIAQCG